MWARLISPGLRIFVREEVAVKAFSRGCYGSGEFIHLQADGAGEGDAGGEAEGDDEEASFFAEGEVVGRGFEAFREGFVGDEDDFTA